MSKRYPPDSIQSAEFDPLPNPILSEPDSGALNLESTLADLPLYDFQVEACHPGRAVIQVFEHYPALPGVVLCKQEAWLGMLSRQRLLEFLIRPQGSQVFLPEPLSVLYGYARLEHLILPDTTPILVAAQQSLRRSPMQRSEPIVVASREAAPSSESAPRTRYRLLDVQDLNMAYWQLRGIETQVRYERMQAQLIQTEKMASLGRLVDGVAHEILDPVGFIWGNLVHLANYTEQITQLLSLYEDHFPDVPPAIAHYQTDIELDYLRQDLPHTIHSIRTGAERLTKLATSLQTFCHIDDVYPKPANLHECLDSILLLLKSRLSGEIQIVKHYGCLPPVTCFAGQLNQVFMNILTNAVDALLNQVIRNEFVAALGETGERQNLSQPKPQITITTTVYSPMPQSVEAPIASRWVSICIADNGPGLSLEQQQQILDSFSIERRAAKETSLAASYQIVTAKHGGQLRLRSPATSAWPADRSKVTLEALGAGTEFEILLPLV